RLNFSLANNLEIKVRNRKDTLTGTKKIPLVDNFTISGSYNFSADSLNLSKIRMSGRTRLWDGFDIMYGSTWDPYALSEDGTRRLNKFEWDVNNRLLRLVNTSWDFSFNLSLNPNTFKKKENKKEEFKEPENASADEIDNIKQNIEDYINWDIPWNLSISYTMAITKTHAYLNNERKTTERLVQTLGLRGDVNLTPKWKIGFLTGWDFENAEISYTSLNIYRDLHCFEMRFNWIPIGPRKSWNFALNIKANILQDAKLEKKRDFRDLY
ncbi:MAG: putative LPS assembly protein LptD, partial [Bacteroidota bacterium]|nr:putative LPS assembly protein LptD [Bacteroidota bacterium]